MDPSLSPAIREARAVCATDVFEIETLEVYHPEVAFGTPNLQLSVVFDRSGSQQSALATIKSVIGAISVRMAETFQTVEFSLLTYESEGADTVLVTGNTFVDEPTFQTAVNGVVTSGGTEHVYAALKMAADSLNWASGTNTVKAMLLITDEDNDSHSVSEQDAIDALAANGIQFLLGFANSQTSWFPNLATGDGFAHVNTFDNTLAADQLEAALNDLIVVGGQDPIYLTNDTRPHTLDDGSGNMRTFESRGFGLRRSGEAKNGIQTLGITIDDVDRKVSRYLNEAKKFSTPVELIFRVYLSDNLENGPENNPPLILYVSNYQRTHEGLSVTTSTIDLVNAPFPNAYYLLENFPLG